MTTASIVAGNTVILKPSSETPAIAYQFVEIMEEAGLPHGVLNFLPGPGASVGDFLVTHPKTRYIAFTGSKEVGLSINELAAKPQKGQLWIKRVVAEMGGKDSIIVDSDCDLDIAAEGNCRCRLWLPGPKVLCLQSRAIIDEKVYDQVVAKVVERTRALKVGTPEEANQQLWSS
jgi:1-pyrroline-5-carboxylate dehydrogenase